MSFLEHLEELRTRIIRTLMGIGVAYVACLFFADQLWTAVETPALAALKSLGIQNARLIQTTPMETFNILWLKLPILAAVFVASPWALFQVWSFVAPGLYKKERRWAAPFIICSAGLFILGGVFAYFVAFRYGLAFLLGIGVGKGIEPLITVSEYFDLFINVMLGVGIVFELPVLIFFLTLIRVATPSFLIRNSRYAILIIVIVAAIVTPTPDVFNLMLFSVPMVMLFYVGIFASYLLVLSREGKKFPWGKVLPWVGLVAAAVGVLLYFAITRYGYHWVKSWPFLTR
jgi:sec-independent protein translocase protein TatC